MVNAEKEAQSVQESPNGSHSNGTVHESGREDGYWKDKRKGQGKVLEFHSAWRILLWLETTAKNILQRGVVFWGEEGEWKCLHWRTLSTWLE